jgi:hypothetical protein
VMNTMLVILAPLKFVVSVSIKFQWTYGDMMAYLLSKCPHCNADFEKDEKDWRTKYCGVECRKKAGVIQRREWLRAQPKEKRRDYDLKKTYGITQKEYEDMERRQERCCAICGAMKEKNGLVVDHDHNTGKVRGLLCYACNSGIGTLQDSIDLLHKAIKYLEETGK